ncbi:MAG TPA: polysaccharide biosynthesis/export family protein [Vicinamibacterales bacterium]|jgi:polysaccharide export outer membrane protein|nr:polysaccharide biosynthesis/export family protein [Vicinamibacterales bacterium]
MTAKSRSKTIAETGVTLFAAVAFFAAAVAPVAADQQGSQPSAAQPPAQQPAPKDKKAKSAPAQQQQPTTGQQAASAPSATQATQGGRGAPAIPAGVTPPSDYVIGPDDVLSIVYWRDKDMTGDVVVRPDGKISMPLLNEMQAAGLSPAQLKDRLVEESKKYIEDPTVTVVVKQINSRKVFITGEVGKPGPYPLMESMTVLQLISVAGGLKEYANGKKIVILRTENGRQLSYPFNYKDVVTRKNLRQNIELKPGDTVIIP